MKVLLFNGSAHAKGCTYTALCEVADTIEAEGIQTEILQIGTKPVQECIGCWQCKQLGRCVFQDDLVAEWLERAKEADAYVFGSPVYYAHPSGQLLSAMDRMFYSGAAVFRHKPAAAVVAARRAGTTCSIDVINKYFTINQMPVVSSTYWNMVYGRVPDEVKQDLEGLRTMRNLGRNMAWLMKCIELGKKNQIIVLDREN